jgi:hypothetical protein
MEVMALTLAISRFLGIEYVLELGETSATIVLCVSFMNYVYLVLTLLGEDGSHGNDTNDILLLEHVPELSQTSPTIYALCQFHELHVLSTTLLGEDGGHGLDTGHILLLEQVLELSDTSAYIVLCVSS